MTNEGDPMTTHMADCRVSYCPGCVSPEIADLGVEARAALAARGKAITPKNVRDAHPDPRRDPMSMSRSPIHKRPKFRRPTYTNATVANPPRHARLMFLRSSCGHVLGLGVVGKRQRFIQWAVCR